MGWFLRRDRKIRASAGNRFTCSGLATGHIERPDMLLLALLISSIGMPAALRASEFERGGAPRRPITTLAHPYREIKEPRPLF